MEGADTVVAVVMAAEDTLDSLADTALVVEELVDSLVYVAAVSVAVV